MSEIEQHLRDLNSADWYRRERAVGSVAILALILALKNVDDNVRWRAVSALGEIGDPLAIPALIATLKDTDHTVRRRAVASLGKIGVSLEPTALLSSERLKPDDKYRVLEALSEIR